MVDTASRASRPAGGAFGGGGGPGGFGFRVEDLSDLFGGVFRWCERPVAMDPAGRHALLAGLREFQGAAERLEGRNRRRAGFSVRNVMGSLRGMFQDLL